MNMGVHESMWELCMYVFMYTYESSRVIQGDQLPSAPARLICSLFTAPRVHQRQTAKSLCRGLAWN